MAAKMAAGATSGRDVQEQIRAFWDRDSETYDRSPGHAASDPVEAAAWRWALAEVLPQPPAQVLDAGAGTGALALLAAELGHRVTALDLSEGMLARAREKALARGVSLDLIVGSAAEPPPGPFDVVMERHLVWTLPDPIATLRAWRDVTSAEGRLVMFEGVWGRSDLASRLRHDAAERARTALGVPEDHHSPYPDDVLARLPLARLPSPEPVLDAASSAGWRAVRFRRLRDVEWAARTRSPWPLGWLEHAPRYVVVADA
jgi:SAM-dependent methyltransferase